MIKRFFFLLFMCSLFVNQADAQILNKLSKAIDDVVDNTVDDVAEKLSEKVVERIIEKLFSGQSIENDSLAISSSDSTSTKSTQQSPSSVDFSSIFGGSVDKSQVYAFSHRMKMQIRSDDGNQEFDYYFDETNAYIGMMVRDMFMILDLENNKTYTILNGKIMTMKLDGILDKMSMQSPEEEEYTITKTGKTETIAGYLCHQYIIESASSTTDAWMSDSFINNNLKDAAIFQDYKNQDYEVTGAIFRYTYIEKGKEDEKMEMEVLEFVKDPKTINFSDY